MPRSSTGIATPLIRSTPLFLVLLAGCGATSSLAPLASSGGSTSSAAAALAPRGPQLGYLWDASQKNLYPALGVAGAAHYGAPLLASDAKYVAGAVSGNHSLGTSWALLLDSNGTLDELTLPSVTPNVVTTRVPLDATITFSPGGSYAVALSLSANTALLISGLPSQPQVSSLAVPSGGTLSGIAVSDRGTVLAGWGTTGLAQTGILSSTGATALASVSAWGGGGFVPGVATAGQEQAVIGDAVTGQLTRLAGIGGSAPTATQLASGGKLQTPVAVAVSGDGLWAFAADSAKPQVVRVDLSGGTAPLVIACTCQPTRLVALPGNSFFRVSTDQAAQPAWLLDAQALAPHTFFVPALASSVAASTQAAAPTATTQHVAAKPSGRGGL